MPPKTPIVPTPPTPPPSGDFAKFDRAVPPTFDGAIPDSVLSQIVTDAPTETPAHLAPQPQVPVAPVHLNPEQAAEQQYRAFLRQEEERLASVPKPPPQPVFSPTSVVPSALGGGQSEPRLKADADPLHVESYFFLRRIVAGGSPLLGMLDIGKLSAHLTALRAAIEWHPATKPVVDAAPVATG